MKKLMLLILMLFVSTVSHATPGYRICDREGDCVQVSSTGALQVSAGSLFYVSPTTGNVGIGTIAPESLLEVQGAEGQSAILTLDADDGDDDADTWKIQSDATTNDLLFINHTTTEMVVQDTGNVGIGTASPSALLTLQSTATNEMATLGTELLSASGWTSTDWTGDWATGFTHTPGNTTALTNTLAATTNYYYQIAFTVSGRTDGTFTITFGGVTSGSYSSTSAWGPQATSTGTLSITPTSLFDGTIIISIKRITEGVATYSILDNTGTQNFAIRSSLNTLNNTFVGRGPGAFNTTGTSNTAVGKDAFFYNTTGTSNTAIGAAALIFNSIGNSNTASGREALYSNTTGSNNTASGLSALRSNTTGTGNVASGREALYSNTTGSNNTASGLSALRFNTTGSNNTASGISALRSNTTGTGNVASGRECLYNNTTGVDNTASGLSALYSNTTGTGNVASGREALYSSTTGSNNTAIGSEAGRYIAGGTSLNETSGTSVYLGALTDALADGDTNEIVIGYNAIGIGSNSAILGNSSITKTQLRGNVGIGTSAPTANLHIDKGTGTGQLKVDGSTGGCLMLRDTDDGGWTMVTVADGVLFATVDADGLCP